MDASGGVQQQLPLTTGGQANAGPLSAARRGTNQPLKDDPGTFERIPKERLYVDQQYQRPFKPFKAGEIARKWSWVACGCLIVGRRDDGTLVVVDGQHRKGAADSRDDITHLPCLVFPMACLRDEAVGFLNLNLHRRPLSAREKHHGLTTAQDESALAVEEMAAILGRAVFSGSDATSVDCIGALTACHREDPVTLMQLLPLLRVLCQGRLLHTDLVLGLYWIDRRMRRAGESLTDRHWTQVCLKAGYDGLLSRARRMREAEGKGGTRITAAGFVAELRLRTRRPIPGFTRDDTE